MADFLFALAKINVVMGTAILIVFPLRRPVRAAFHASIAYALWLLVPAMVLASLLPPRAMSLVPIGISFMASAKTKLFIGTAVSMPKLPSLQDAPHIRFSLVFAAWLMGMVATALYLLWLQRGFHRAERAGLAGPALAGFIRPRVVVPADFTVRFSAPERAAILAHEQAHLARQDTRVNAVMALLRCLCWFNPLVHLASVWMRRDQELACDAAALQTVPRLDYANTLLKAQMPVTASPLGCAWPGSEHPLTERIALLMRPAPERTRRWAGILALAIVMLCGGVAAWAQQEPAHFIPEPTHRVVTENTAFWMYGKPVYVITIQAEKMGPPVDWAAKPPVQSPVLTGAMRMDFPYGSAEATSGSVRGASVILNDVELTYGEQTLHGKILTFDPQSRLLALDGKQMASGIPNQPAGTIVRVFGSGAGFSWACSVTPDIASKTKCM